MTSRIKIPLTVLLLILTIWFVYGVLSTYFWGDLSDSGQFGDSFGGVNSLFQGLALAALVYTITIQIEQLNNQQKNFDNEIIERRKIENFEVAKWLYSEIKIVLEDFEFAKRKGHEALIDFVINVYQNQNNIQSGLYDPLLENIDVLISQFITSLRRIRNLEMHDEDRKIILQKMVYTYQMRMQDSFDLFATIVSSRRNIKYIQDRMDKIEREIDKTKINLG